MATAMWAKSAVGTNLGFVRDFGRILKSWREILQSTLQKKQIPAKPKTHQIDVYGERAKGRCLYQLQPTLNHTKKSLQSQVFRSVLSRTTNQTIATSSNETQVSSQVVADTEDEEFDLAVKAVFNYSAESNACSILSELQREMVPLRPEGNTLDAPLSDRVGRLPPHPNIVDMPGIFVDKMLVTEEGLKKFPAAMPNRMDPENFYGHNKTLYLVMRRRNTHLREFLSKETANMATRCKILSQLLEGVAHLGQHGVAHRDLKADNILVDVPKDGDCPRIEICDFGCCLAEENRVMKIPYPTRDMYLGGNSRLMAPEILTAKPGPDSILDYRKSDLWAAGTLAYEILGTDNPFYPSESNSSLVHLNARNYKEEELPKLPDDVPEAMKQLVQKMLARDPKERPTPSVAAAVAQMAALALSSNTSPPSLASTHQQGTQLSSKGRRGLDSCQTQGKPWQLKKCHLVSTVTAASYHQWLVRKRKWLNWILAQGLTLVCQLTFGGQSKLWSTESAMTFLFLSRLTYSNFQEAMAYF